LHHSRTRAGLLAAAGSIVVAVSGTSAAQAATVTVTGDDGNPAAIAQGTTTTIRNMSPNVQLAFPPAAARYSSTVTGPDGTAVSPPQSCYTTSPSTRYIDFRGNGNYTVTITNFASADTTCKTPTSTETYVFTIASSVTLTPPAGPFLIRAPNSFVTNSYAQPVALNPGASTYELKYALGGVVGPDGAISGPSADGYVSQTTGTADLRFTAPGTYTVVARAKNGDFSSPWSAPVTVTAIVPFDLTRIAFPDSRGPSYRLTGYVKEKALRGKVSLALARGTKGGKYKSLGTVSITSKGTFSKRFTQRRTGAYRLRVHYKGSSLAPATSIVSKIRITRRVYFG
jgi:hypothetical protein